MFHKILVAFDRSEVGKHVMKPCPKRPQSQPHATACPVFLRRRLSTRHASCLQSGLLREEEVVKRYLEQLEVFKEQGLNLLRSRTEEATAAGVDTEFIHTPGSPGYVICDLARTWVLDRDGASFKYK